MIKYIGDGADGRVAIGLGLSDRNIELLRLGRPIRVDLGEMSPRLRGLEVHILWGPTEQAIVDELAKSGAVSPDVRARVQHETHEGQRPGEN